MKIQIRILGITVAIKKRKEGSNKSSCVKPVKGANYLGKNLRVFGMGG